LRVFENRVLRRMFGAKRDKVTGEWRRLLNEELNYMYSSLNEELNYMHSSLNEELNYMHSSLNEELNYMYSSPYIIRVIRVIWAEHIARKMELGGAYSVLVGKPEGKTPLGRTRHRWENNS